MKRSHGPRNRTRSRLRKNVREKGMPPVTHSLREFDEGDRVSIRINPAIHKAMPHPRFHGKTGVVTGKQGKAFLVAFRDGKKEKIAIVGPEHLVLQE
ncbi:MAG: 50S ribosomal protein L21e [Candidatus Thermoplasmatota archaeon]|nr:50S ribosomal protein L21e [Candidatus Thermoplasmatota archaeon]